MHSSIESQKMSVQNSKWSYKIMYSSLQNETINESDRPICAG